MGGLQTSVPEGVVFIPGLMSVDVDLASVWVLSLSFDLSVYGVGSV